MKTGAIILCRTTSRRFPGKILEQIHKDISLLEYVIKSVKICSQINTIVIATTYSSRSQEIESICDRMDVEIYYGSENNVFDRFSSAALEYKLDIVARINADCPFILPKVIDYCFCVLRKSGADYVSTILHETFPIGLHVEVLKSEVFRKIEQSKLTDHELEHVTPFIYNNPKIFKLFSLRCFSNYSNIRLTIDYPEDLEFCKLFAEKINITDATSVRDLIHVYDRILQKSDYEPITKSQNMLISDAAIDYEFLLD